MRLVDLSAPIRQSPPETPEVLRTDIEFSGHAEGAAMIESLLGVPASLLRDGEGWAVETFTRFGTHNSTHVDAPWHYNSRIGGEPAQTIDELPLDWFFGPGVVLDMSAKEEGETIDVADVEAELERIGHELRERDIVLVRTGRDAFVEEPGYMALGPGVTVEATRWLYERGVRVMGIDAWGWDGPLHLQAQAALESKRTRSVLGGPPGGPPVLADRAPREPRRAAAHGLPGGLLPAEGRGRGRSAGAGSGHRPGLKLSLFTTFGASQATPAKGHRSRHSRSGRSGPGAGTPPRFTHAVRIPWRCAAARSYLKPNATWRISSGRRADLAQRVLERGVAGLVGPAVLGHGHAVELDLQVAERVLHDRPVGVRDDPQAQPRLLRRSQRRDRVGERLPALHRASEGLAVAVVPAVAALAGPFREAVGQHLAVAAVVALEALELEFLPARAQLAAGWRAAVRGGVRSRIGNPAAPPSQSISVP